MSTRSWLLAAAFVALPVAQAATGPDGMPATRPSAGAAPQRDTGRDTTRDSCERRLRAYERSAACYARFRTVHGIKAEAAERCGPPVKEPVDCRRP